MSGTQINITPPNLPVSPKQFEARFMDQYSNVLRLFFNAVTNNLNSPTPHGSFYSTATQTNPVSSGVNLFTYNNTASNYAVFIGAPDSRIYVAQTGLYDFQFSAQMDKTGGGKNPVYIWPRVNGSNLPNSATKIVIGGPNDEIVPAWDFLIPLQAGDYFELAWSSTDTNVIAATEPATGDIPAIPSIILSVMYASNVDAAAVGFL
jgi:hypothetical protein